MPAATSSSPNFIQGLLQSLGPWMSGGSPSRLDNSFSQYGGTQGLLDAMLQAGNPNSSAAQFGKALEGSQNAALQRAGARQQLAMGNFGMQRMAQSWPLILQAMQGLGGQPTAGNGPTVSPNASPAAGGAIPVSGQGTSGASPQAPQASQAPSGSVGASPASQALGTARLGAMLGLAGMPGGQGLSDYAKLALQYDPATTTALATAKNQVSQDIQQLYQAYATGNPNLIQGMVTKLKTDMGQLHIGSMSGIMTQQQPNGSWTTVNPSTGLRTNTGTGTTWMPGALQAFAARSGAEAASAKGGELGAETAPAGNGAAPAALASGATAAARVLSALRPQQTAPAATQYQGAQAVRQEGYIPPILEASSGIPQRPGNTSLGQLQTFQKEQSEHASELADNLNEQAQNAQMLLTQAGQIDDAARDFSPGKLAETKRSLMEWGQQFGMLSQSDLKALGSAQEGDKLSIQLQARVTKQLGSREAAQVFSVMGKSIPNLTLSPDGLWKISAYLKGIAQYQIAQNTFAQRLAAQGNVSGVNGLPAAFQSHSNPVYYILASAPPQVAQELIANMPARERASVQGGWKQAISQGLAPAPGEY